CTRFASYEDLEKNNCTIEEREEFEPHIDMGAVIFAGVDYEKIGSEAMKEADVIVWDGGNNDLPFFRSDLHIVVADPHRPNNECTFYPGEANVYLADVIVINKIDSCYPDDLEIVRENIMSMNPKAAIVYAASPVFVNHGNEIRGKSVLVIEDGPTLTHGNMTFGAGVVAANRYGAKEIVDPKEYFHGTLLKNIRIWGRFCPLSDMEKNKPPTLKKQLTR
ncbi:hypothetical protein HYY75_03245, partial [bacterium]|nr:hypothetical protein [bacterium]